MGTRSKFRTAAYMAFMRQQRGWMETLMQDANAEPLPPPPGFRPARGLLILTGRRHRRYRFNQRKAR